MTSKRKIIYDSEDDDVPPDKGKKARAPPDNAPAAITNGAGMRRSERTGKGNGGRLAQMKQFEQLQTDRSKQLSRLDIATQGEDVNPMAPSFQDVGEGRFRRGQASSNRDELPAPASTLQPELLLAAPGEKYGFKIPDVASQPKSNTQAPTRTRFPGVYSQTSSNSSVPPPGTRSVSLFSNTGPASTSATTQARSICSSGDHHLARQHNPAATSSSHVDAVDDTASIPAPRISRSSKNLQRTSQREDLGVDSQSQPPSARIQRPRYSLFDSPANSDDGARLEIDEVSPSEDDRIAEANLGRAEDSRELTPPNSFQRESTPPDDSVNEPGGAKRYQQSQPRTQSRDDTVHTRRSNRVPDNEVTSVNSRTAHANRSDQHVSRTPGNLVPSQSSLPTQHPENVVNVHRRRNHAPRLPSNSHLLAARQRQHALSNVGEIANNCDGPDRPSVDLHVSPATDRSEPWQLQFYDPPTRDVIDRAKQLSHCDAASIDPFPVRAAFNSKAVEYIDEAIAERRSRGLIVSDGWWPQNASSISRLLWEDLSSWRSALRKKSRAFVTQRYQWDPENRRDRNIAIAKDLLGNGGLFLRDGVDAEGRVNNLAHPALAGLVVDFFYSGPSSVGKLFPEVFGGEVPRVTVAIAATALKVVLDEVASGEGEVNFRVNTYSPVYAEILALMSKCDTSDVHSAKTSALRKRWAQLGSNGMRDQEMVVGGCGFDVDLD